MGYPHYWTQTRDLTRAQWADVSADLLALLKDVQHVQGIPLSDWEGEAGKQPEFTADRISFNGVGEDSHESFVVDRKRAPKEMWEKVRGQGFCKTARKPYDLAVTAALCYLATVGGAHDATSDGHGHNWLEGLAEARRALPRYANVLDIPRGVLDADRWIGPWPHLFTEAYRFNFCVDGFAYIEDVKGKRWYRFASHAEAARWFEHNRAIIDSTGYFDETRRQFLKKEQNMLFARFFTPGIGPLCGADRYVAAPAFVRPDAFPAMEATRYVDFAQLLAL